MVAEPRPTAVLETGVKQLLRATGLFNTLNEAELDVILKTAQTAEYPTGSLIIQEGAFGDGMFIILDGAVQVFTIAKDGRDIVLQRKEAGQHFGEQALLPGSDGRRSAGVRAYNDVTLLHIQRQDFQRVLSQDSPLKDRLLAIGRQETVPYEDPSRQLTRQLVLAGRQITGVISHGLWTELGKVRQLILDKTALSEAQLGYFRHHGILEAEKESLVYRPEDIVCECLQINYDTLTQAVCAGSHTADALAETTGASTVCGSCRPQLGRIVGQEGWTPVMLLEEFEVVEGIRSFRFAPYDNVFKAAKPGQHVIIQAYLDGKWVQRPYTISSPAGETRYREITIKREPFGYFSNWLFDRRQEQALLRLSNPQGEYIADLTDVQPIVCLVAGIGVTPALAILRSSLQEGNTTPLLIDYCVRRRSQLIYQEELQRAASENAHVAVRFRVTEEDSRISQADIDQIRQQHPGARYYICGPDSYRKAVSSYLAHSDVPTASINIEEFTPVGGSPAARTAEQRTDQVFMTIGLILVAAFLLQALFQIKWPWLENIQVLESYKRWSGLGLLLYMGGQWILPYLRFNGRFKAAARHYRLHKRQGAFMPLVYYFHSTAFGYGYLLALSSFLFANLVLGFLEPGVAARPAFRQRYSFVWLATHVALSVLIMALVAYHIFVVFYYQ